MLEQMLEHGLPDITPHCLNAIRNVFEADIESIPEEPELPDVSPEKAEKIAGLIRIVDAQYGVTGSKNLLNHLERVFILGHRNKVMKVFPGEMKHNRAKKVIRKMKAFGLGAGDLEAVYKALKAQEAQKMRQHT